MVEVEVHGIGIDARRAQPIVLLREVGAGGRMLPIWVAEVDAAALVSARDGTPPARPDTHTLIGHVVVAFGRRVTGVVITALRDDVYHAELVLDGGLRIDSRASDALTIALRLGVGISVEDAVFTRAGVPPDSVLESDDEPAPPPETPEGPVSEDEVERFRRLLDDASPSDFEKE